MKPTFSTRGAGRNWSSRSAVFIIASLLAATTAFAQKQSPAGGDTLDTSTPAPKGMEGGPVPATEAAPAGTPLNPAEAEAIAPEPAVGGFIIPIEGDVFYEPDLRVLVSVPGAPPASMALLVDGYPETSPLSYNNELVTVQLHGLKSGVHTLTLLMFNEHTEIIGKEATRFFIRLPEPLKTPPKGQYKQFGRVVTKVDWKGGEARGRILSQSPLKYDPTTADSLRAGKSEVPLSQELEGAAEAAYNVKYKQVQAYGKVLLRTDEDQFRQPSHRISANVKLGPWASIKAGDVYPLYNPLVLNGTRVRGGEAALAIVTGENTWGSLKVVRGESRRAVDPYIAEYDTGNGGTRTDTVPGTFAQELTAARLGLGGGPAFDLGFTLLKASDRIGSDENAFVNDKLHGLRPAENLVPGVDLRIGFWQGKIQLYANSAMSLYTKDISLGAFHPDTFAVAFNPVDYKNIFIFNATTRGWQYLLSKQGSNSGTDIPGFLNSTSAYEAGVETSIPLEGVVTETEIRYSHLGLEYHSEGNPFLGGNPGDGVTLIQKLIVLDNRLSLAMEVGNYNQDLGFTSQTERDLKGEIRFTPGAYQPSFWVGGGKSNIVPDGDYIHQFRSGFLNFNTGGYYQFQLPDGKLHTTLLYGFTQSDLTLEGAPGDTLPVFPTTQTHIINAMAQYKMRYSDFLPRMGYTFAYNGIQRATSSVTLGFMQPFSENRVKLDLSTTIGQYPKTNTANDLSVGEGANLDYYLSAEQTFQLREKWIQYGDRRNITVGANYEMFF